MRARFLTICLIILVGGVAYAARRGGTGIGGDLLSAVTATSFIIGANTLDTNEWAFLDGQDQDVSSDATGVSFASMSVSSTLTVVTGTDLPGTCAAGELFLDTNDDSCADSNDGSGALCVCISANVWAAAT